MNDELTPQPDTCTMYTEDELRTLVMNVLDRAGPMENKKWVCEELIAALTERKRAADTY